MGRDLMPAVVDVFAQQLGQSHSTARRQLALAVGPQFRDVGAPLVPALMEMLKSDEQSESWAAAQALGFIGPEARQAVPQLIRAAQYGNELATVALGEIGDPRALRTLDLLAQEEGDRAAKTAARKIRAATAPTQPAARSASGPA
jgi:HEAT repeat protein